MVHGSRRGGELPFLHVSSWFNVVLPCLLKLKLAEKNYAKKPKEEWLVGVSSNNSIYRTVLYMNTDEQKKERFVLLY